LPIETQSAGHSNCRWLQPVIGNREKDFSSVMLEKQYIYLNQNTKTDGTRLEIKTRATASAR
jgi:hypothetical protein